MWHTDYDIYVVGLYSGIYVVTTNNGSHYWTVDLNRRIAGDTPTSLGSFDTSGYAANTNVTDFIAVGAVVARGRTRSSGSP